MKIALVRKGIDVQPMLKALGDHPELWNQHGARTAYGPHTQVSDIWVRYNDFANFKGDLGSSADRARFNEEHESVWYPSADALPAREYCWDVMHMVRGQKMGGVLITRIPPGGCVEPHIDHGWHARYYEKFAIQLASTPEQKFCFEDESLVTEPGDLFWFDNSYLHWVVNPSKEHRMTMIICIKRNM